jgi:hypothetical protein
LAKVKCYSLDLNRLTSLSEAAAQELAKFNGAKLELNGLTTLSDATAGALAKMKGTLTLGGLATLSDAAAAAIAERADDFELPGLQVLTDSPGNLALAERLAKVKCYSLDLNRLTSLSEAAAQELTKFNGAKLELNGLAVLSGATAGALAKIKWSLELNGLTTFSEAAAQEFAKFEGHLYLQGITNFSEEITEALALHRGRISLNSQVTEVFKAARVKLWEIKRGTSLSWESGFLKGAKKRFNKVRLLKDKFDSLEEILSCIIYRGTSADEIYEFLDDNDLAGGGDLACEMSVEFAWVVGAWDVPYSFLSKGKGEDEDPRELAYESAQILYESIIENDLNNRK